MKKEILFSIFLLAAASVDFCAAELNIAFVYGNLPNGTGFVLFFFKSRCLAVCKVFTDRIM